MVKHIVLFNVKEGEDKAAVAAIAASVLGGASMSGGAGSVLGTLLGTVLIILIDNIGTQFGIGAFVMQVVTGCVIVAAIVIDQLKKKNKR